jgi:hypothetical protein
MINDTGERLLTADNPQAELLWWHYWLGHISFARLCILALLGTIPRKLIHAKNLKCAGCMYGAMTKWPWRTKAQQDKSKIKSGTRPGDCISVDQLESWTLGFITQLKGALTKKWYQAAMVFGNHASWLSYIHHQQGLMLEQNEHLKPTQDHMELVSNIIMPIMKIWREQCIYQFSCKVRTNNKLLWSQCTFSEWCCRKTNQRLTAASKETTSSCQVMLAISNEDQSLAVCTWNCEQHTQHDTRQGRW